MHALTQLVAATAQSGSDALAERVARLERTNAELQVRQAELRELFDLIPAMIWFKDRQHRILKVNRLGASVTGRSIEEIEGRSAFEIYPQRAGQTRDEDDEVMASGKARLGILRQLADSQRRERWIELDKVPFRDDAGNVTGIVIVAKDVSARQLRKQALRDSDKRMRAIVDCALDCIISMDELGRITEFNPAAERTLRYRREQVLGKKLGEVLALTDSRGEHVCGLQPLLMHGQGRLSDQRIEMIAMCADGERIPVELSVTPIGPSETPAYTAFLRDITDRRRGEQEIARMTRSLKMLSSCNAALFHAEEEQELLEKICRISVEVGGYSMAGVGYAQDDAGCSVSPVASFGDRNGLLSTLVLSWSAQSPRGQGPAGQTIRSGMPVIIADIASDPRFFASREESLRCGYRSLVSLPLRGEERAFGLLGLYSSEVFTAGQAEIDLLQELADNLSFGVAGLRTRQERQREYEARGRMERKLAESLLRQQALSRRMVDVRESEQQHLSRELHDRIGQNLTALGINLDVIGKVVAGTAATKLAERLSDSRKLLELTIGTVRDLITELRPGALDDYGLLAGLLGYVDQLQGRTGLAIAVLGAEPQPRLAPAKEAALFRVAQEALLNCVKHARARSVTVRLSGRSGFANLEIVDDGMGFDPEEVKRLGKHWGLEIMRERAEAVAGTLTVDSVPGRGTRIAVVLGNLP